VTSRQVQPIITGGATGAGDEVFLEPLDQGRIRFGLDTWGTAADFSPPLTSDPGAHEVAIFGGAQALASHPQVRARLSSRQQEALRSSLVIWWDGSPRWITHLKAFPNSFDTLALGTNALGFSSASPVYDGPFDAHPYNPTDAASFLEANLKILGLGAPDPGRP
jgi:hypothetical protein